MEKVKLVVDSSSFYMVHMHNDLLPIKIEFEVFPIIEVTDSNTNKTWFEYCDKNDNEMPYTGDFDPIRAVRKMRGSVCWRGCWETRIYFEDDEEYWGNEFVTLATLFKDHIAPWCKDYIRKNHVEYDITKYEDNKDEL